MAVGAEDDARGSGHPFAHRAEHGAVLSGEGVTHGVGQIDRGGPFGDGHLDHATEKVQVGATGILGREFDVIGVGPRLPDGLPGQLQRVLPGDAELVLQVQVRRGNENVDPGRAALRIASPAKAMSRS